MKISGCVNCEVENITFANYWKFKIHYDFSILKMGQKWPKFVSRKKDFRIMKVGKYTSL